MRRQNPQKSTVQPTIPPTAPSAKRNRRLRGVIFRLAAVLIGLLPFLLAETVFTLLDWGRPELRDDPFVGFQSVHPLFRLDEAAGRYEIAPPRLGYFRPDSFEAEKPTDTFRVFCLGGSTVQGRPFATETSFTTWLEISLEAADPSRRWEVVNCGGVSYASYRLVPILDEVLGYEPDLIILYTGHNEFLEDRTYRHVKHLPDPVARPLRFAAKSRTFVVLNQTYRRLRGRSSENASVDHPVLKTEVDAMLEYQDGFAQYHRDPKWRRDTIDHFRCNLERMVQKTRQAGVPLVLVNPVANLRDCPPFKSQHRDGLTPEQLARWESLLDEAGRRQATDVHRAVEPLEAALAIDDRHAGLHYTLAQCLDRLEMTEEARVHYIQAKEQDVCPLRILEPMHEIILDVARRTNAILVDVRKFHDDQSDANIPGNYRLVDHVHPSITGHQRIGNLLADAMVAEGFVEPDPDWHADRDRRYREHFESLDDLYFAKGQERLGMIQRWARDKTHDVGR